MTPFCLMSLIRFKGELLIASVFVLCCRHSQSKKQMLKLDGLLLFLTSEAKYLLVEVLRAGNCYVIPVLLFQVKVALN